MGWKLKYKKPNLLCLIRVCVQINGHECGLWLRAQSLRFYVYLRMLIITVMKRWIVLLYNGCLIFCICYTYIHD